jgi:hypothetical protein
MSGSLKRRLEKLEEEARLEQVWKSPCTMTWFDPTTGVRTDAYGNVVSSG